MQIPIKHWSYSAACKGMDTEIFFAVRAFRITEYAKTVCRDCPVQFECLEDSMKIEATLYGYKNRHGIFGGMTPKERQALAKQRMINGHP